MTISRLTVLLVFACLPSIASAQPNLPELARRQALRDPTVPVLVPTSPESYEPQSAAQLAKKSALVVEAKLVRLNSYLWRSNDRVLTDYLIVPSSVVAGTVPVQAGATPGATAKLILIVAGGEITLNGAIVRETDVNCERIDEQATYLLFLNESHAGGPGRYEIYNGAIFEVRGTLVRPLAKHGADVFSWSRETSRADVLEAVRAVSHR